MESNDVFGDFVQLSASSASQRGVNLGFHKSGHTRRDQDTRRGVLNSFNVKRRKSVIRS